MKDNANRDATIRVLNGPEKPPPFVVRYPVDMTAEPLRPSDEPDRREDRRRGAVAAESRALDAARKRARRQAVEPDPERDTDPAA